MTDFVRSRYMDEDMAEETFLEFGSRWKLYTSWRWHHLLSQSLPNGSLSRVSRRLGRERFILPYAATDAHGAMNCEQKSFVVLVVWRWHQLLSWFPPNVRLSRVSRRLDRELFTLPYAAADVLLAQLEAKYVANRWAKMSYFYVRTTGYICFKSVSPPSLVWTIE